MNNTFISDEASRSQAIETQVLENRDEHNLDFTFNRLLNVLPILNPFTTLYGLPTQPATHLNSMSSLQDFKTLTSNAKKKNIAVAPGILESLDFPIWPPCTPYSNYRPAQSQLDIALARNLHPSLYFIQPEIAYIPYHGNEYPSLALTSSHISAGMKCQRDSPCKSLLIYYEGKEEIKKKSSTYKASHRRNVKRKNRKSNFLPKRPLSAYNMFFKDERGKILSEIPDQNIARKDRNERHERKSRHGKISFECLAKEIGQRWHSLDPSRFEYYKALASKDMVRYKHEKEKFQELGNETKHLPEKITKTLQLGDEGFLISSK
jgi:hypothetical protein